MNQTEIVPVGATLKEVASIAKLSGYFGFANEQQAFVKLMAAQALNIPLFTALNEVYIIPSQGGKMNIELSCHLIAALIRKSGIYDYRVIENTAKICKIEFFMNGESIGHYDYSIDEAKQAGLLGKTNWKNHPRDMLYARCISGGGKRHCPDIFMGSVYFEGEISEPESKPQPKNGIEVHDIPPSEEPNPSIVPDYSDEEIQKLLDRKDVILKRAKEYEIDINQTALDSIESLIECGNFRKLGEKLVSYEQHLDTHVGLAKAAEAPIETLDLNNLYEILRNAEINESYVNTWFGEEIKTYTVAKQAGDHKLANELIALMMERAYGHIEKEKERRP